MAVRRVLSFVEMYVNISTMNSRRNNGDIDIWLVLFICVTVFFLGAISFGVWAFMGRQDYKNNSDQKSAVAAAAAVQKEDTKKNAQFVEAAKLPFRTYIGPEPYGSLHVMYPKTWSAYVDTSSQSSFPLNGYFNPDTVPSLNDNNSSYALRVQIDPETYSQALTTYSAKITAKTIIATPYSFPKVTAAIGVRLDGQIDNGKTGSMVIVPLRDKTLKVWITAPQYISDFNNNILPNITFSP
jgi:hypothetical protein